MAPKASHGGTRGDFAELDTIFDVPQSDNPAVRTERKAGVLLLDCGKHATWLESGGIHDPHLSGTGETGQQAAIRTELQDADRGVDAGQQLTCTGGIEVPPDDLAIDGPCDHAVMIAVEDHTGDENGVLSGNCCAPSGLTEAIVADMTGAFGSKVPDTHTTVRAGCINLVSRWRHVDVVNAIIVCRNGVQPLPACGVPGLK